MTGEGPLGTARGAIGLKHWRSGAQPIWLFQHLGRIKGDVRNARSNLQGANYVGDEERIKAARAQLRDALEDLRDHLLRIADAGLLMPRQNPDLLADMDAVGLDDIERLRRMTDEQWADHLDYWRESMSEEEFAKWRQEVEDRG